MFRPVRYRRCARRRARSVGECPRAEAVERRVLLSAAIDPTIDALVEPRLTASVTAAPSPATQSPIDPHEPVLAVTPAVPALSSLPSANAKLYLDFDGDPSRRWMSWAGIGGYVTGDTPAFDTDGDPTHFSNKELEQIRQIWAIVAEKYSPFNLDITTIDPGQLQDKKSCKIVIGGDGAWLHDPAAGGVSIVGGFNANVLDNNKIGWVWDGQGGGGDVRYVGEAVSHEAGHIFGLLHRSDVSKQVEYLSGFVMGRGDTGPGPWGRWSVGQRGDHPWSLLAHADTLQDVGIQDDVAILSGPNNGFGFRPDEAGVSVGDAATMTVTDPNIQQSTGLGVISQTTDADAWRFNWSGGALSLSVSVPALDPMLFATLELRDSNFNIIATASASTQGQTLTANLPFAGTYYAVVRSRGQYGDIGQYQVLAQVNQTADNTMKSATRFGLFGATGGVFQITSPFEGRARFNDFVGSTDPEDFYSFVTGPTGGVFTARLYNLTGDADLELIRDYNNDGVANGTDRIASSANGGTTPENIGPVVLTPNTVYYVHVYRFGTANANYTLDCFIDESGNSATATTPPPRDLGTAGGKNSWYDYVDTNDVDDYYRFTTDNIGQLNLALDQLGDDADLYLYTDNGSGTLTQIASSTNTGSTTESITGLTVQPGTSYVVQVRAYTLVNANTNYRLSVDLDYAPFSNNGATLLPSTPLPNIGVFNGELVLHDFIGPDDQFDTFKMLVPPGGIHVVQTTDSTVPHLLQLIYDANGNNQVDSGEVLASGTTDLSYTVPDLSGTGLAQVFLRVSVNSGGEFLSNGNYTLHVAGANVADRNDSMSQAQPLGTGGTGTATVNGQLYGSPDIDSVDDLEDWYTFTLSSPQKFTAALTGAPGPALQVFRDANSNGQIDPGERLAGAGTFAPVGRSALAVNLPAGTYFLHVFILEPTHDTLVVSLPYTLTTSVGAFTDTTPPTVTSAFFDVDRAPHGLSVQFSEDVSDSLDPSDLAVQQLSTAAAIATIATTYDAPTNTAGASFGTILPDGNYRLTIPAGAVRDGAGNALANPFTYDFFFLSGDANHDRHVDLTDFTILAANFNAVGRTFSQGNFSYDAAGSVDLTDFTILAANFNKFLAPPPAARVAATVETSDARPQLSAAPPAPPASSPLFNGTPIVAAGEDEASWLQLTP